ncbi:MAG: type II toxin-antitoxin system Phd/YefM family antitoxin [Anaerolineales bacterium]|nr:type II toxin-antitoxin system Phd/YefM family antitoxin [Anaerolineales bacterium]
MVVKSLPILPISDLRARAREVITTAKMEPTVITQRGRPQVVMIAYESYNEMVARLEALESARDALIMERALATAGEFYSVEEALADYETATGVKISPEDLLRGAESE